MKRFKCIMSEIIEFEMLAEDEEQAMNWMDTHDMQVVKEVTKDFTQEYNDKVIREVDIDNEEILFRAIDITSIKGGEYDNI